MSQVIGPGVTVDEGVEEYKHKATKKGAQHLVLESLERGRGVAEAEWHDEQLVKSVMGPEHHLGDVCWVHS